MSYYKEVDGKRLDGRLLELADQAIAGSGDGRVSKADAERLLVAVKDGGRYTEVEQHTVAHILANYKWTDHAQSWFESEVKSWRSSPSMTVKMKPSEMPGLKFPAHDVLTSETARASRLIDLKAATAETMSDHDEIGIIVRLQDGTRVEVLSNMIELEGDLVELRGGVAIPLRAIEKVEI